MGLPCFPPSLVCSENPSAGAGAAPRVGGTSACQGPRPSAGSCPTQLAPLLGCVAESASGPGWAVPLSGEEERPAAPTTGPPRPASLAKAGPTAESREVLRGSLCRGASCGWSRSVVSSRAAASAGAVNCPTSWAVNGLLEEGNSAVQDLQGPTSASLLNRSCCPCTRILSRPGAGEPEVPCPLEANGVPAWICGGGERLLPRCRTGEGLTR